MGNADPIWFVLPLVLFEGLLGLWTLVFVLGSSVSRCKRCGKPFHDLDDVVLMLTPFGFRAAHGYPCKTKHGGR